MLSAARAFQYGESISKTVPGAIPRSSVAQSPRQSVSRAARAILDKEAEALNALLMAVGPDRDLVNEPDPLTLDEGNEAIAPKRPRLYPI
ncbi:MULTISPECIES: hypothetical protein [unclassified Rhodococcus (in: high G+C Gram-positive bacteria)]|uniref:hypothetical protein n=1 Tax=unclassified Rhodococcus (in: high G+C Gram-positive bacteria) TaxID=192944 RepID=UPI0012F6814D|nr:hypothetical protein [Rhodococcus sp. DK17]